MLSENIAKHELYQIVMLGEHHDTHMAVSWLSVDCIQKFVCPMHSN